MLWLLDVKWAPQETLLCAFKAFSIMVFAVSFTVILVIKNNSETNSKDHYRTRLVCFSLRISNYLHFLRLPLGNLIKVLTGHSSGHSCLKQSFTMGSRWFQIYFIKVIHLKFWSLTWTILLLNCVHTSLELNQSHTWEDYSGCN